MKSKGMLIHATAATDSETSKEKQSRFPSYEATRVVKFRDSKEKSGYQGLGREEGHVELLFNGDRVSERDGR